MATARLRPVDRLAGNASVTSCAADQADEPVDDLVDLVVVQASALAQREGHVLPHAERVEQSAVLEDHGHALADGAHALFAETGDLLAFDLNRP